jgi:hypothetical protein
MPQQLVLLRPQMIIPLGAIMTAMLARRRIGARR